MDETVLTVCSSFDGRFTVTSAIKRFKERGNSLQKTPEEFKSLLLSSSSFIQVDEETFEPAASIFQGARFYITPLPIEQKQNFLLLGHRAIPYYNSSLTNSDLIVTDDFGKELSRRKRELPWHIIKKYNIGASFKHQVTPENVDVPSICQDVLEQSSVSGSSLYPEITGGQGREDLAFHLDMKLSEKQLMVETYEYQIPVNKLIEARVEDYEQGVLSIRPIEGFSENNNARGVDLHTAMVEEFSDNEPRKDRVFPFLTRVYAKNRQLLQNPGDHWIHVILNSSELRIRQPGVDPRIEPATAHSDIRSGVTEFLMNSEFEEELQQYEEHPEELVEEARDAHAQGKRKSELYLWFIEQIGELCHDPLLDLIKSDEEEDVVFAVTALEAAWTDDLEQPLKFIASDDRLSKETRNGAMYLLVNLGSEKAREYTARMVEDSDMVQENTKPEDLFDTFVHTPEARIELLRSEEPNQEAMLKELIKVQDPRLIFIGGSLVYSARKSLRETGREALMRSGVPLVRDFFHDLQNSPLAPLKQLSGTPLVNGERFKNEDAGVLKRVLMSNFEPDGSFMTVFQAGVDDIDHLLFLQQSDTEGIIDAHYVTVDPSEEEPDQLLNETTNTSEIEPFQVDADFAREITLQSEHHTLEEYQRLPDEYKYGKMLMYLPGDVDSRQEEYETFTDQSTSCSDDEVYAFCRGESLETMKNYVPLCAFEQHNPRKPLKEKHPTELCETFRSQLATRFSRVGYLLFMNEHNELARVAVEANQRIDRATEEISPILEALNENLQDFQESFSIDSEAIPDVLGDLIEDVN